MRIYFAGPLFTSAEQDWNAALISALRDAGHEVFAPQEQEKGADGAGIFARDVAGIAWADCLVAIVDGADPDAGTSWEIGYAYEKKPIILVRTDMRRTGSGGWDYNSMLSESATIRIDTVIGSREEIATNVLAALERLKS